MSHISYGKTLVVGATVLLGALVFQPISLVSADSVSHYKTESSHASYDDHDAKQASHRTDSDDKKTYTVPVQPPTSTPKSDDKPCDKSKSDDKDKTVYKPVTHTDNDDEDHDKKPCPPTTPTPKPTKPPVKHTDKPCPPKTTPVVPPTTTTTTPTTGGKGSTPATPAVVASVVTTTPAKTIAAAPASLVDTGINLSVISVLAALTGAIALFVGTRRTKVSE